MHTHTLSEDLSGRKHTCDTASTHTRTYVWLLPFQSGRQMQGKKHGPLADYCASKNIISIHYGEVMCPFYIHTMIMLKMGWNLEQTRF